MASIDDDQRETEKPRSEPDKATTEAALRSSDHTTIDYSRFDAVEVPEDVVIERRSWGPTRDKRTAPLRITLNAKRFTLAGPWLRRRVCDLGRAYLKSQKIFRVFRLDGAAQTRVELGLLAEVGECLRDGDVLRVEVTGDDAVDVMEFPLEFFDGLSSGGVLRGPSTTVDAYVDGGRVAARPAEVGPHTLELADGATATRIIRAPAPPPRPWAALPASIRRATVEYLRAAGAAFAVERADTASLPLPPRSVGVSGEPPAPGCATVFRSWYTGDRAAIAERARTLVDACPADAIEVEVVGAGPARNPATLGADGLVARRATLAVAVHGDVACTFPRLGAGRVVDVDDVDAEGAVVTKTGARCLLRRGDALLRSNVDAHGRVDHQMDVAYDGKVLEVHFFSRRAYQQTTETIAIVEDATSDDVLDELERRVNDADFVLPEALVQWRAPATRKGLVPEPLDALRCVAELLPAGCAGSMTLRERACWRGNGAPAARAYQVDVDAEVPSDARRDLREWAEKRRIDVRFLGDM